MSKEQQQKVMDMVTGYWVSQAIYASTKLGVPDLLKDGPRSSDDIANQVGANHTAMYRLLRALASVGLFEALAGQQFRLTSLGGYLCAEHPLSLRAYSVMGGDLQYETWSDVLYSIKTGKCAYDHRTGSTFFEDLGKNPKAAETFSDAMTSFLESTPQSVVEAYDFSEIKEVVDLGGAHGTLLSAILRAYPQMKGVLFDLPHVVEAARPHVSAANVTSRCKLVAGSFFESIPAGADAYILSTILHDWDDEHAVAILKQCRKAIAPTARLLVVEMVIEDGNDPFFGKWLDLHVLVMHGGRDRTEAEYRQLFETSGFQLRRTIRTNSLRSILEAVPV